MIENNNLLRSPIVTPWKLPLSSLILERINVPDNATHIITRHANLTIRNTAKLTTQITANNIMKKNVNMKRNNIATHLMKKNVLMKRSKNVKLPILSIVSHHTIMESIVKKFLTKNVITLMFQSVIVFQNSIVHMSMSRNAIIYTTHGPYHGGLRQPPINL